MKKSTLSLLFVAMMTATAPAAASDISSFLFGAVIGAVEVAGNLVIGSVKDSMAKKESVEDRKVRENAQIESAAEEILAQYPAEEREARKPEVMMMLTKAKVQSKVVEERLAEIRDEQNSVGAIVSDTAKSAIGSTIGSRSVFDSAARTAALRARY